MGKATRWLKALLGMKREKDARNSYSSAGDKREKNRWSFSKSGKEFTGKVQTPPPPPRKVVADADWQRSYPAESEEERNEHAIAVAAASAAAADAAVAAAQAAAAVVRLTNQARGALFIGGKEISAALKIQNVFRGYLARKALRALKGLVKLQALIRGYLVRKRAAATLQSMQALIRAQTTVRSYRARRSHNKENKSSPENKPKKSPDDVRYLYSHDIEDPKIVEIDTFKTRSRSRRFNNLLSELADDRPSPYLWTMASPARFSTPNGRHVQDLEWSLMGGEECGRVSTAHSTPRVMNSGWPGTPAKSVYGEGYFRPYSNFPNYMASTQSFKAKLRSRSAPKQRPEVWSKKRVALNEIMGPRNSISSVRMQRTCHDQVGEGEGEEEGGGGFDL